MDLSKLHDEYDRGNSNYNGHNVRAVVKYDRQKAYINGSPSPNISESKEGEISSRGNHRSRNRDRYRERDDDGGRRMLKTSYPKNSEDIRGEEFDRWWKGLSVPQSSKDEYYIKLEKMNMNFITLLKFIDKATLKDDIGMTNGHYGYFLEKINEWLDSNERFVEWIKKYKWYEEYYTIFENNGILTFESLYYHIHSEKQLRKMLKNDGNRDVVDRDARRMWDKLPRNDRFKRERNG